MQNFEEDLQHIRYLLELDNTPVEVEIATFSIRGEVKKGLVFRGDHSGVQLERIKTYLELADYFPRIVLSPESEVMIAGDGVLIGYVGDYEGEIDYEL